MRISEILDRSPWLLRSAASPIKRIQLDPKSSFHLVQDDSIHPIYGGNKARKLDAVLPRLVLDKVTDVVRFSSMEARLGSSTVLNGHPRSNAADPRSHPLPHQL